MFQLNRSHRWTVSGSARMHKDCIELRRYQIRQRPPNPKRNGKPSSSHKSRVWAMSSLFRNLLVLGFGVKVLGPGVGVAYVPMTGFVS